MDAFLMKVCSFPFILVSIIKFFKYFKVEASWGVFLITVKKTNERGEKEGKTIEFWINNT